MKIIDALQQASSQMDSADLFFGHGTDNAWDEACFLLAHVLGCESLSQDQAQDEIPAPQLQEFQTMVRRRVDEKLPAAYLTGRAWFAGFPFEVTRDVLVPRSPIAELIQRRYLPWAGEPPQKVLDLCTGSGCIGIATALAMPQTQVCLADISAPALEVARRNRDHFALQSQVDLVLSDLFEQLGNRQFDLIVSNPPYVDQQDVDDMPEEFQREPLLGLAAGNDGLDLVRRILLQAPDYLLPGGVLVCEVGNSAQALEQLYEQVPFTWVEFEMGGEGVFVLDRQTLLAFRESFEAAYNALRSSG